MRDLQILEGTIVSKTILESLKHRISGIESILKAPERFRKNSKPKLAIVKVGNDYASSVYVQQKQKKAAEVGIEIELVNLEENISQDNLSEILRNLNLRTDVNGIIVQSPLPRHLSEQKAFNLVDSEKDVDGFGSINLGKLTQEDNSGFLPCTPFGITKLMKYYKIQTKGAHIVIIGRSIIVGKPMGLLLLQKTEIGNATVTIAHSQSRNLGELTKQADILISAIGSPNFITGDMLKKDAIVIDVGINRVQNESQNTNLSDEHLTDSKKNYRLVGDVDFLSASKVVKSITPVPGGVGQTTVAMLLENTFKAYCLQNNLNYSDS